MRLLSKTAITWASDNITKTTTYTFADKTTYVDTAEVQPTEIVSWAADHITKTTITTYGNGKKLSVITQVPGTVGTPTYNNNIKTVVTTYGDGTSSTATFTASSSSDSWASDHITKTTTHTYASGGSNSVITTVNPTSTTPALTNAVYPSDWTTTGTVTPPNVSSKTNTYGDGYTNVAEDGTSSKPFLQTTLSGLSISDPSKYVTSNTTTYDLRWGTPDKLGPLFPALFPNFPIVLGVYGVPVQGYYLGSGPTFTTPSEDVLAAWNNGWTGSGKNILTVDTYENAANCNPFSSDNLSNCHGITTALISGLTTAIGATRYLLDASGTASIRNFNGTVATPVSMNVVNLSYTYTGADAQFYSNITTSFLGSNYQGFDLSNAVITKAAGNTSVTSNNDVFSKTLADNSNTAARLLIVGAVDGNGSPSSRVSIASYSNTAGTYAPIANRFVLANGNAPWATGGVYMNGWSIPGGPTNAGTSYAAPLVAGYAAIIQQKFPGLNAANTSNIILDTARYDTLTCYPSCDTSIYGKGEASLSRALAPVGRLR